MGALGNETHPPPLHPWSYSIKYWSWPSWRGVVTPWRDARKFARRDFFPCSFFISIKVLDQDGGPRKRDPSITRRTLIKPFEKLVVAVLDVAWRRDSKPCVRFAFLNVEFCFWSKFWSKMGPSGRRPVHHPKSFDDTDWKFGRGRHPWSTALNAWRDAVTPWRQAVWSYWYFPCLVVFLIKVLVQSRGPRERAPSTATRSLIKYSDRLVMAVLGMELRRHAVAPCRVLVLFLSLIVLCFLSKCWSKLGALGNEPRPPPERLWSNYWKDWSWPSPLPSWRRMTVSLRGAWPVLVLFFPWWFCVLD